MHPLRKLRESGKPTTAQDQRATCRKHRIQQPDPGTTDRRAWILRGDFRPVELQARLRHLYGRV